MTPQERQLIDDLFDHLEKLENAPRDGEAEAAIAQGLRRAPHAVYALVQTVLIQDEALKRASARIEELEGNAPEQRPAGGFLDSMRDTVLGPSRSRGSVPEVQPNEQRGPIWNAGQQADPRMNADPRSSGSGGGGSFLGTAAAAAAGVIGGSMLMNSIRGLMGGGGHQGFGDTAFAGDNKSPWGGDKSNNDLARDAGINDIGKGDRDNDTRQNFAHENLDKNLDENSDENSDDAQFNGSDEDGDLDADDFDPDDSDFA